MEKQEIRVKKTRLPSTNILLPFQPRQANSSKNGGSSVVKVTFENGLRTVYLNWSPPLAPSNALYIDSVYADILGIPNIVSLEGCDGCVVPNRVEFEPLSALDYSLSEKYADYLEMELLNQVRIVAPNQPFCVRVLPSNETISFITRFITFDNSDDKVKAECFWLDRSVEVSIIPKFDPLLKQSSSSSVGNGAIQKSHRCINSELDECLRASLFLDPNDDHELCAIETVGFDTKYRVYAYVDSCHSTRSYLYIDDFIRDNLHVINHQRITIRSIGSGHTDSYLASLTVEQFTASHEISMQILTEMFLKFTGGRKTLIYNGFILNFDGIRVRFLIEGTQPNTNQDSDLYLIEKLSDFKSVNIEYRFADQKRGAEEVVHCAGVDAFITKLFKSIHISFKTRVHLEISGDLQSGKSNILRLLEKRLSNEYYVRRVDCLEMLRSPNTAKSRLYKIFWNSILNGPSLLLLDDLDTLMIHLPNLKSCLSELVTLCQNAASPCVVIYTCKKSIAYLTGISKFSIPIFEHSEQLQILQEYMAKEDFAGLSLDSTPKSLSQLLRIVRSRHRLAECKYLGDKSVKANQKDIPGFREAKKTIQKALMPVINPSLYSKTRIPTKAGLLLYGPPGCGKTFLASRLAQLYNLHAITVNAPELIDKYIGASEESVRQLFVKARLNTPSMIFIDEFETIGGKRGQHGMTDRIVNQLLTELDGVDELNGVLVVAACQNIDAIDPALLRPGRLDTHIYLGHPSKAERLEILQWHYKELVGTEATSRKDIQLVLEEISAETEGLASSDLRAIVENAKIEAVYQSQNRSAKEIAVNTSQKDEIEKILENLERQFGSGSLLRSKQSKQEAHVKATTTTSSSISITPELLRKSLKETLSSRTLLKSRHAKEKSKAGWNASLG